MLGAAAAGADVALGVGDSWERSRLGREEDVGVGDLARCEEEFMRRARGAEGSRGEAMVDISPIREASADFVAFSD